MSKYLEKTVKVGECLEWQGCFNTDGYPRAGVSGNSNIKVHREVFFYYCGYYPSVVRHSCDNIKCINPNHLLPGTIQDNVKDCIERGRFSNQVFEDEMENVLSLRKSGMTYKQIAEQLGTTYKRVEYIMTKKLKNKSGSAAQEV